MTTARRSLYDEALRIERQRRALDYFREFFVQGFVLPGIRITPLGTYELPTSNSLYGRANALLNEVRAGIIYFR